MGAVAKGLGGGRAATTKLHPLLCGIFVSVSVFQFYRAGDDERPVFPDLDSYFSHDGRNLKEECVSRPL